MALKREDFAYYKNFIQDSKSEHGKAKDRLKPDDTIRAYQGRSEKGAELAENHLMIAALTILPTLFFQFPRIIIRAKRDVMRFQAAILNSLANIYFDRKAKKENELCIIDAFLPWGYAVMKNGYNSRTGKIKSQSIVTGKSKGKTEDMESEPEFLWYEKPVILRQNPRTTYLDHTQPFGKGNAITFEYKRTLQELIDSNLYSLEGNFVNYFKGRGDAREVDLTLTEHWCMKNGYAWKLVYVDGWEEELLWVKSPYQQLPVSYLRFNKVGDDIYNISHGRPATVCQEELNYNNAVWDKHIDNLRNQIMANQDQFTESGWKTLNANTIGGIVGTNGPVNPGIASPLTSGQVDPALFGNIQSKRSFLNQLLSTSGGKAGESGASKATEMKLQAGGDQMRTAGLQDAIRDFCIDQVHQLIRNIVRMGSPEMIVKLTGENLINPMTGEDIAPGQELQIGGQDGFTLKELINGDIDTDFVFDVDIVSAQGPDFPVMRKQLMEGITMATQLEPLLRSEGKKINFGEMVQDYFKTFDTIPNADKYIQDLSEEEKAQMQQQQTMAQMAEQGGQPPTNATQGANGVPTVEHMQRGAAAVPTTIGVGGVTS